MFWSKRKKAKESLKKREDFLKSKENEDKEIIKIHRETPELIERNFPRQKTLIPKDLILLESLRSELLNSGALTKEEKDRVLKVQSAEELKLMFEAAQKCSSSEEDYDPDYEKNKVDFTESIQTDNVINPLLEGFDQKQNINYNNNERSKELKEISERGNFIYSNGVISSSADKEYETVITLPDGTKITGKIL